MKISKELEKSIAKISFYSVDQFELDAISYIAAIRENRMGCIIRSVAKSGMNIKIFAAGKMGYFRQYSSMFSALGFSETMDRDGFRVNGCGMDMVFDTNSRIIHELYRMEFMTKEECDELAQKTPSVL